MAAMLLRRAPLASGRRLGRAAQELGDAPRLPRTAARCERRLRPEELRDRPGRIGVERVEVEGELRAGGVRAPHACHCVQPQGQAARSMRGPGGRPSHGTPVCPGTDRGRTGSNGASVRTPPGTTRCSATASTTVRARSPSTRSGTRLSASSWFGRGADRRRQGCRRRRGASRGRRSGSAPGTRRRRGRPWSRGCARCPRCRRRLPNRTRAGRPRPTAPRSEQACRAGA